MNAIVPFTPAVPVEGQETFVGSPFGVEVQERIVLPPGLTLAEMVDQAVPEHKELARARLQITIMRGSSWMAVDASVWHRTRLKVGVRLFITVTPGGGRLKTVLGVLVTAAAYAVAGPLAAAIVPGLGVFGTALVGAGITLLGTALISLLFPTQERDDSKTRGTDRIEGLRNVARPGEPLRTIFGTMRIAPDYVVPPYTEIAGDEQYVRAVFCVGYGHHELSDFRIGDTSIDEYEDITLEIQDGSTIGGPFNLVNQTVIEDRYGLEMLHREKLDAQGVGTGVYNNPNITRMTANHASSFTVIVGFPSGLVAYDNDGNPEPYTVSWSVQWREKGATAPSAPIQIDTREARLNAFFRSVTIPVSVRGPVEVTVRRVLPEADSSQIIDQITLISIQTHRAENPINVDFPLCMVAVRIRASYQLNGTLDSFNCLASRLTADFDGAAWVNQKTDNPASHFLRVLRSSEGAAPLPDSAIDWDMLQEFHTFCADKGLTYNGDLTDSGSMLERLAEVAAAGRAAPRYTGTQWTMVMDRPSNDVVAHFSPLNVSDIRWSKQFPLHPHAYRVPFLDAGEDYEVAEQNVPWPGVDEADIVLTETLQLSGKVYADEVFREARRKQYEAIYRDHSYTFTVDGIARPETRGDLVALSFDTVDQTLFYARVGGVQDRVVTLIDEVEFEAGQAYAIRFVEHGTDRDASLVSLLEPRDAGMTNVITLSAGMTAPEPGTTVYFGPAGEETIKGYIVEVSPAGKGWSYTVVPAAPEIDALTDAEIIPEWIPIIGAIPDDSTTVPSVPGIPIITQISDTGGAAPLVSVYVDDDRDALVRAVQVEIDYRKVTVADPDPAWNSYRFYTASRSVTIANYAPGDDMEFRVRGLSAAAVYSPYSAVLTYTLADQP